MKHSFKSFINNIKKKNSLIGMTMAEMLIAILILSTLFGVAFIAVQAYMRSMGQLERDKIAMEIFVAAQNHLTVAYGADYYNAVTDFGTAENAEDGIYYTVYKDGSNYTDAGTSILDQMLPFGSIDETIRAGGSYIIRYNKNEGKILDVFYCSTSDSPNSQSTFNHQLVVDDYGKTDNKVLNCTGTGADKKSKRRDWIEHSILGWYGGAAAETLESLPLEAPDIQIINAETLKVKITDDKNVSANGKYILKLIITGKTSGAKKSYVLLSNSTTEPKNVGDRLITGTTYDIILDDITSSNLKFSQIASDTPDIYFIPGENLDIQAVAYSNSYRAKVAYSSKKTTNSLFANVTDAIKDKDGNLDGKPDTAYIRNIRHLENLDRNISKLKHTSSPDHMTQTDNNDLDIKKAIQTSHLFWDLFINNEKIKSKNVFYYKSLSDYSSLNTKEGCYYPINPDYSMEYEGSKLSISNIKADWTGASGLFGAPGSNVTSIKNLELKDFSITGTSSAGALAGELTDTAITNVIARNTDSSKVLSNKIMSTANESNAGGLVGKATDCSVFYSAASVIVEGKENAGGLIGYYLYNPTNPSSDKTVVINGCYSGGHTTNGSYEEWVKGKDNNIEHGYDVKGNDAGGLIGNFSGINENSKKAIIKNSYSTCSVQPVPNNSKAGGFVGTGKGEISNCYATGLVATQVISTENDRTTNNNVGAFAGSFNGDFSGCLYFGLINEVKLQKQTTDPGTLDHYLGAVGDVEPIDENGNVVIDGVSKIDENADTYNDFIAAENDWGPARPYDLPLATYYNKKYNLKSVLRPTWTWTQSDGLSNIIPSDNNTGLINKTSFGGSVSLPGSSLTDYFVSTHYGDWPSPEIFIINQP